MSDRLEPIVRRISVRCPPERAFRVFTEEINSWWPVATHSRATSEHEGEDVRTERIEFQTGAGGRVLEHLSNGEAHPWAEILEWDPPHRFVMAWKPHARPQPPTEVEVRFDAEAGVTLVILEHRGWERLTEDVPELYGSYAGGWIETLGRFAAAADRAAR